MKTLFFRLGAFAPLLLMLGSFSTYAQNEPYSEQMAKSIMARNSGGYGGWNYVTGTVLRGFEDVWRSSNKPTYYNYLKTTVNNSVGSTGTISSYNISRYNIDQVKEGCATLLLYKMTGGHNYLLASHQLRLQLQDHPRTSLGGFWHKQRYPWQMWLDGLYMGCPFYAEYGALFNQPEAFNDVVLQITEMEAHSRDSVTGLLYHGWDQSLSQPWANPVTGLSANFWGRGMGWYAMAIVDVLDYLPENHPGRDTVIGIFNRMAQAIANAQDADSHVWWQVLDRPKGPNNYKESSASCMFVYALAKALRLGYIDDSYRSVITNGYQGILNEFITTHNNGTISLDYTCAGAGLSNDRDGSYEYYTQQAFWRSDDGKGEGPFMQASVELELMDRIYPPGNLLINNIDSTGLLLTWKDNSRLDSLITIERKADEDFVAIATVPANATSYTDTTLAHGTTYSYRIKALSATDTSAYSNQITTLAYSPKIKPAPAINTAPLNLSDGVDSLKVTLSWETNHDTRWTVVYFDTNNPPNYKGTTTTNNYTISRLKANTTYYWRANTANAAGETEGPIWSFTTDSVAAPTTAINKVQLHNNAPCAYPNPATNKLTIKLNSDSYLGGTMVICNALGLVVLKAPIEAMEIDINLNSYAQGAYFAKLSNQQHTKTRVLKLYKK